MGRDAPWMYIAGGQSISTETTELTTQLQLSLIYKRLLADIFAIVNVDPSGEARHECFGFVKEAFNESVNLLSQRCPKCDSSDVKLVCNDCWKVEPLKEPVRL